VGKAHKKAYLQQWISYQHQTVKKTAGAQSHFVSRLSQQNIFGKLKGQLNILIQTPKGWIVPSLQSSLLHQEEHQPTQ